MPAALVTKHLWNVIKHMVKAAHRYVCRYSVSNDKNLLLFCGEFWNWVAKRLFFKVVEKCF